MNPSSSSREKARPVRTSCPPACQRPALTPRQALRTSSDMISARTSLATSTVLSPGCRPSGGVKSNRRNGAATVASSSGYAQMFRG